MKKYIILVILLIIGGGAFYLANSYEAIVKNLVHKYGSQVTGTDVSLEGFKISLTDGEGRIKKIVVANPKGYKSPHFISLDGITVKVNIKSLASDTIIIDSIVIDKPSISYEILSLTQNNLKEIQNNINSFAAKSSSGKGKDTAETEKNSTSEKTSEGKKVIIKKLQIKSGEIIAAASAGGLAGGNVTVLLPDINMNNIGGGQNGNDIPQIIIKVMNQILKTASQTVAKVQIGDLKNIDEKNLDNVVGGVKDRVKTLGIFGK